MTRSEASRVNGAKSRGPKTPEGRARSSQNARKHGVLVHAVVLRNEDPEQYDALAREYYARYGPDGPVERKLVDDMILCDWRQRRAAVCETAAIDLQMDRNAAKVDAGFERIDEPTRTSLAITDLTDNSRVLDVHNRYETRYYRQYHRALATLRLLQNERNANLPNKLMEGGL